MSLHLRPPIAAVRAAAVSAALVLCVVAGWFGPQGALAAKPGSLEVRVVGVPAGQKVSAVLAGPGVRRSVRSMRTLRLRRARPGWYRLKLAPVRISRRFGTIRAGAVASASQRVVRVRVRSGRKALLRGAYTRIVNPGVQPLASGRVTAVAGPAGNPSEITLAGRFALGKGAVVSIPPSAQLPRGLLSYVVSARPQGDATVVSLRAAPVFEVVPNYQFEVPLDAAAAGRVRARRSCSGLDGLTPRREIRNIRFSGGWATTRVFGQSITTGIQIGVQFDAEVGVRAQTGIGVECSLTAGVSANGMAGPVPVTAGIEGELSASAAAGAAMDAGGVVPVAASARTIGTPPTLVWLPNVTFGSPRFSSDVRAFAQVTAGIGLGVKLGVGNDYVASATVKLGASTNFTAKPRSCVWDARFGEFSAGGKILGWTISTPKTPALYRRDLWRGCSGGATSGSGVSASPGGQPGPNPGSGESGSARGAEAAQVTAGGSHSCAVSADAAARCWGANFDGRLGDGTTEVATGPVRVQGVTDAAQISAAEYHTCVLTAAGGVNCWGRNDRGQLGDGTTTNRLTPVPVPGLSTATDVSVGSSHACAVSKDGTVWCWGDGVNGKLGDGTTGTRLSPVQVQGISTATDVAAGDYHTCAVLAAGAVRCWGSGQHGMLGDGSTLPDVTPTAVQGIFTATAVDVGTEYSCARLRDGTIRCWGLNDHGQLGDGTTEDRLTPVAVQGISSAAVLAVGDAHSCVAMVDRTSRCWGRNKYGQLGDGTTIDRATSVVVGRLAEALQIDAGWAHTCATVTGGGVRCWGWNGAGNLGDGLSSDRLLPVSVLGFPS